MTDKTGMIKLSAIAAIGNQRVIGHQNQLPWRLPADLKHFKAITTGHPILMGRKTYQSIGKPLPNRTNLVLTRDVSFTSPGIIPVQCLEDALQQAASIDAKELFVIGGADIYQQLLPYIQKIYLTLIHHDFVGDTFFPALDSDEWQQTSCEEHAADADNPYAYSFIMLERVTN